MSVLFKPFQFSLLFDTLCFSVVTCFNVLLKLAEPVVDDPKVGRQEDRRLGQSKTCNALHGKIQVQFMECHVEGALPSEPKKYARTVGYIIIDFSLAESDDHPEKSKKDQAGKEGLRHLLKRLRKIVTR